MYRVRTLAPVILGALMMAAAVFMTLQPTATGHRHHGGPPHWWGPPADVRAMLRDVSAAKLKEYDLKLVSFGTRHTLSEQDNPTHGIGAARDYIKSQFDQIAATANGRMTTELQSFIQPVSNRIPTPTRITNVLATLHGTDPSQAGKVYVVTGHYDSRRTDVLDGTGDAPGANDDGSGTSAVIELARVMAKHPPEATVVFAAVAGEEQGLYGSDHLAQVAKDEGWNIQGNLNMDIIGSPNGGNGVRDPHTIRLFSEGVPTAATTAQINQLISLGGENDSTARQLARYVYETGSNRSTDMNVKLIWRRDRFLRGGDQISFLARGWPAVRFTEPNENFNHQHQDVRTENGELIGDLPQYVDYDYLARVTRVIASSLAALSRSPAAPTHSRIIAANLSYDTELRWDANKESDIAGYEVVWRDTKDPLWTHSRFVGNVTDYTLKGLNKDDNQVGVRAVDRDGNRSPVAFPVPANQ
jgi:hypothetical protein